MAFPTTITTDGLGTVGCAGPFANSAGDVFVVLPSDNLFNLRALKGVDPSLSFTAVGTDQVIGLGGDVIRSIAGAKSGAKIHVAVKNSNGSDPVDIRYYVFNMNTETFSTAEVVKSNLALASGGVGWRCPIDLAVRADGAAVIIYNGSYSTVAATNYDRVYYARKQTAGGAWTADFALGTAGVAASWIGGKAVIGALDRVHFFLADRTNDDLYHQSIDSGFSLEALPASPISVSLEDSEVSWAQGAAFMTATGVVQVPIYKSFETLNNVRGTSQAAMSVSVSADITGARAVLTAPIKYVGSYAVDGSTLYNVFIDTANDVYTQHYSSGAWSTPTGFHTGSASAIYANVYTRSSMVVLGMVMHESGDPKYHELTLSVIAAGASLVAPNSLMLMGVGT